MSERKSKLDGQVSDQTLASECTFRRSPAEPSIASEAPGDTGSGIAPTLKEEFRFPGLMQLFFDMTKVSPNSKITKILEEEIARRLNAPRSVVDDYMFEDRD